MSQDVDVISMLKIQAINEFEQLLRLYERGHYDLNVARVLDMICYIESSSCFKDAETIGDILIDISDYTTINLLEEFLNDDTFA